jgi:uncharacterized membrane protein YccC
MNRPAQPDRYDPSVQPLKGRFRDPNRVNLRKALRATFVVPVLFAIAVAADNDAAAVFISFGAFAALVFSDYGGPLRRRFRAYVLLAIVGGLLVALGTACADTVWPAVVMMLVVAFVVSFSGALGGYIASSVTAATLGFVLGVMTPGVGSSLWSRELGWVTGVVVAGVAAVALWPVHQRDRVRLAAVTVLREVGSALKTSTASRDLVAARAASDALVERAGVVYRPAGSITRERALVALVVVARRLVPILDVATTAEHSSAADDLPEYGALAAAIAATLDASARALAGDADDDVDVAPLEAARDAHTVALERWAAQTIDTTGADAVLEGIAASFPLRRLSLATAQIAHSATLAARDTRRDRGGHEPGALPRAWLMLRAHCDLRSVRFRNAARAGLGLALAVLVAKETSVEHAFWVVLGALSVLRSSALGTGATALQALTGALLGFGLASALMVTVGGDSTVLWIGLPVVVFLAAYTPGAVNFVVGQASFTVFVVVLFNLVIPEGWRTGLVRVQDVAIGAAISVGVGALLWPRGARGVARREFAELLRAGNRHLRASLAARLHGGSVADVDEAAAAADDSESRATAALEDLALEHGGGHVDREAWGSVLLDALLLKVASDGIVRGARRHGTPSGCASTRAALDAEAAAVEGDVDDEAGRVERTGVEAPPTARDAEAPPPPHRALTDCLTAHAHDELDAAMGLVWVHEWLELVADRPR